MLIINDLIDKAQHIFALFAKRINIFFIRNVSNLRVGLRQVELCNMCRRTTKVAKRAANQENIFRLNFMLKVKGNKRLKVDLMETVIELELTCCRKCALEQNHYE